MPRQTDDDDSVPTKERVSKTIWFAKTDLSRFEEACDQFGTSPVMLMRKVARDYAAGRYVQLEGISAEVNAALEKKRAELGVRNVQPVLEIVLNEWARMVDAKSKK